MFICEECAKGKVDSFWFSLGMGLSRGKCEFCGEVGNCVDVHHSQLEDDDEEDE